MSKSNSLSKESSNSSFQKENPNSSKVCCSKCHTLSLSSITIKRQPESKGFNISITCENNHSEETPLKKFDSFNHKISKKECQHCNQKISIKEIFFCFKCKKYYCFNCKCDHYMKGKENISHYYGLLENRCPLHGNKIKEFYCKQCVKYLCKDCLKSHNKSHNNVVNLMEKFDNYQRLLKNEINNEKNLLIRYNKILNAVREIMTKNIEQKKYVLELKKRILNSYINNNMNYFNNKNIDFAKNQLNDNVTYDQTKVKKLYDFCKKNYMNPTNNK